MRIFLTGATGFIGTHIIPKLQQRGHTVIGLTRSDTGAEALRRLDVEPYLGTLEEPKPLAKGAESADAVIHCAFDHDFTNFVANCEKDARVITALGEVLKGSGRSLIVTSGVGFGSPAPGETAVEQVANYDHPNPRSISEKLATRLAGEDGVAAMIMRLPQVHDTQKQGLITPWIAAVRQAGEVNIVGEGRNRFSAAAVKDVAELYALAIEQGRAGERFHAVDEEGIEARQIAEVLARKMGMPMHSVSAEEAPAKMGFMAMFASMDLPASSTLTRERLGWRPSGSGLIEDLEAMDYGQG